LRQDSTRRPSTRCANMRPRAARNSSFRSRESLFGTSVTGALLQRGVLTQFFIFGAASALTKPYRNLIPINGLASQNR
jgi:hypothetical protein